MLKHLDSKIFSRLLILAVTLVAAPVSAQYMDLIMPGAGGGKGRIVGSSASSKYVAPGRLFQIEVPANWNVTTNPEDPGTITFIPKNTNLRVFLAVRRVAVPQGASAVQLALNAKEQRLSQLPLWQEQSTKKVVVAGRPAVVVTGTYNFQGNIEYPIVLEELIVTLDGEAFLFHFECFSGAVGQFSAALEKFYSTFIPRPTPEQLQSTEQHKRNPALDIPY